MSWYCLILRGLKTGLDLSILTAVFCLAFVIRFEGSLSWDALDVLLYYLPWCLLLKLVCLVAFGIPKLTWRYVSLMEARRIFLSLGTATAFLLSWRLVALRLGLEQTPTHSQLPLGVLLIDLPLSILAIVGVRVFFRLKGERGDVGPTSSRKRVVCVLVGAGRAGALVAKELAANKKSNLSAIGFVDELPHNIGQMIQGIPILGTLQQLRDIVRKYGVTQALITKENTAGSTLRGIARLCESCGITAKILPGICDMAEGKLNLSAIRDIAIEDLLRRDPVRLDSREISKSISGSRVLITGAGGSIGSELCRLVCRYNPALLILLEQAENSLFYIHREITQNFPDLHVVPCIADVCDVPRVRDIFSHHQPEIVFHAAAHKHVPLMEWNPGEAVKNNVLGTRIVADLSDAFGVDRFVMISTDKAVNPSSVMGVSKRAAEIYIQALSERSQTRFVAVRFGNVLGSNGSVIPIFKDQIAKGGPVTVTHPEMKRYFMTIPEACQLVLQAATMGQGGEIFILDMGEPVKIVDLVRDLIRLSGLHPDRDIEIRFSGIRPGEKLFEELSLEEECAGKTSHPRIFVGRLRAHGWEYINRQIDELVKCATAASIRAKFMELVPEYRFVPVPRPAVHVPAARLDLALVGADKLRETDSSDDSAEAEAVGLRDGA